MNRPDTLADVARRLQADREVCSHAMAGFLDNFYMNPQTRQRMIDEAREFLDNPILDAVLGGIGEHLAQ